MDEAKFVYPARHRPTQSALTAVCRLKATPADFAERENAKRRETVMMQ
jgi:hypothetical protein